MRDKDLFAQVGSSFRMPMVNTIDTTNEGKLQHHKTIDEILHEYPHIFCKPIDDMCGNGAICIDFDGGKGYLLDGREVSRDVVESTLLGHKLAYIIQPRLIQHKGINDIYHNAINTLRIVTINPKHSNAPEDIVLLCVLLRLGANGSTVDNWAKGGLIVGVNEDGSLHKYGYYKPGYGTKTNLHPDTGFVFDGATVPFYDEAIKKAKDFHSHLHWIHSIGWDVAITENGPVFIEGNDNWELGFVQIVKGGIQKQIDKYFI